MTSEKKRVVRGGTETGNPRKNSEKEEITLYRTQYAEVTPPDGFVAVEQEIRIDEFGAALLGVSAGTRAGSKSFRYKTDPWNLVSTSGIPIWTASGLRTTYISATDPQTGVVVAYATVLFTGQNHGWGLMSGSALHLLSETAQQGLLEDWVIGNSFYGTDGIKTFSKTFNPNWYALANYPVLLIDAGTWVRPTRDPLPK
jgi:hypothetical protein